jgi:DNA-binding response OmpR family regulator
MPKRIILAVDDEPMMTRLIQVNLERAGYEVRTAPDGVAALKALQSKEVCPDLILLDVTMPYMDGFELLRQIKDDPELEAIPVIMMTARSRDEDIIFGQSEGAVRYLPKPVHPDDLLGHVQEVLGDGEEP